MDIFLRVDRRRAARFPYNGNFTVYGAFSAVFPGKGRVISRAVLNVQAGGIGAVQGIILACRKAQHLNRHNVCPRHKVGRSIGSINKPFFLIQGLLWPLLNKLPVYIQLIAGIRGDLDLFLAGNASSTIISLRKYTMQASLSSSGIQFGSQIQFVRKRFISMAVLLLGYSAAVRLCL